MPLGYMFHQQKLEFDITWFLLTSSVCDSNILAFKIILQLLKAGRHKTSVLQKETGVPGENPRVQPDDHKPS